MIKVTPPTIEQLVKPDHAAYIVGMKTANSQPEIVGSAPTLGKGHEVVARINAIGIGEYPRFVAVSRDDCIIDPDAPKPARLPVRWPIMAYPGPYPLVAIVLS